MELTIPHTLQAAPGVTTAESFPWRVYLLFYLVATGILANLAFGIWALHQFARVWHRLRPRWTPKMAGEAEESDQEDLPEWDAIGEAWNMDTAGGLGRVDDTPPRETGLRHRTGREFEHRAQPVAWRQLLDYMTPEMQRNHGTTRPTSAVSTLLDSHAALRSPGSREMTSSRNDSPPLRESVREAEGMSWLVTRRLNSKDSWQL